MKFSSLCLMSFFSVTKSSEVDSLIQKKKAYIKATEESLNVLNSVKIKLDNDLFKVKMTNTAGNIASIAGTALMFTPFFFVGLTAVGLGTATSVGSSVYENYFMEDGKNKKLIDIIELEKDAEGRYSERFIQILATSSKAALIIKKSADLKRMYDVSRGYRVAYNGVNGVANAMKAGTKMTNFGIFLGGFGATLSAADIVMTWTMSDETSELFGKLIQYKEEIILEKKRNLKFYRIIQLSNFNSY